MPKMKSKSAVTKRFKKTGSGRIKRGRAFTSHQAIRKTKKQRRQLGKSSLVSKAEEKNIKQMM